MPLPRVFGTEHELVINIRGEEMGTIQKFDEEMMFALRLIKHFHEHFFPDIPGNSRYNLPTRAQLELFDDKKFAFSDKNLIYEYEMRRKKPQQDLIEEGDVPFFHGFMTPLGSRYYIDHGYFEYASPECDDPFVYLACELAEEELIAKEFENIFGDDPRGSRLYKNVSDGRCHSQAAHRNFCVSAEAWRRIVSIEERGIHSLRSDERFTRETKLLATWHVVEQILTGAGKYGDEYALWRSHTLEEEMASRDVFQISGRADFAEALLGEQTTANRPIINRRDEPLADRVKYGRYHCICGDANRAEWPHLFKMGLTAMVLGMLEDGAMDMDFCVTNPVRAIREVSLDPTCKKPIGVTLFGDGRRRAMSPIKIMQVFLAEMERYIASRQTPEWCGKILEKAKWAVWALDNEPRLLGSVLDWKIKELGAKDRPNAFNIHLNYHALSGQRSFYRNLYERGMVETAVSRDEIEKYKAGPPETTRAYFRGNFLKRFYKELDFFTTDWYELVFQWGNGPGANVPQRIQMLEPLQWTKKEWGDIFGLKDVSREHFKNFITRVTMEYTREEDE